MKNIVLKIPVCLIFIIAAASACNSISDHITPPVKIIPTETIVPTKSITPTIRPILTSTMTALPTLSPDKANEYVLQMLETNGNCEFPCWWGISPGVSSWDDTRHLLAPIAIVMADFPKENGSVKYEVDLPDPEGRSWNKLLIEFFYVNNAGIVEIMAVPVKKGNLQEFFKTHGIPNEIWVYFGGGVQGATEYMLAFFYQEKGMMVITGGRGESVTHNGVEYLRMCSDEFSTYSGLGLWYPHSEKGFYDIVFALDTTQPGEPGFGRISEVTNMDEVEFYNEFSSNIANSCIETPYDAWPVTAPSQ
jgi:hypothetical protein